MVVSCVLFGSLVERWDVSGNQKNLMVLVNS